MKVRATSKGYYLTLKEEGQIFEIEDETHLGSWMEVIEVQQSAAPKKAAVKKRPT